MKNKRSLIFKFLFLYTLIVLSCNNVSDEPSCCDTVDLSGQWNMNTYWHELPNGDREVYAQNNSQAFTSNLFPDLIEGQIVFNEDKSFSENFKFVLVRDSSQIDTIETNLSGTFIESIQKGGCDFNFDRGSIMFQTQSGEINSSVSKNCTPGYDFPIILRKRVNQDSISFYIWRQ